MGVSVSSKVLSTISVMIAAKYLFPPFISFSGSHKANYAPTSDIIHCFEGTGTVTEYVDGFFSYSLYHFLLRFRVNDACIPTDDESWRCCPIHWSKHSWFTAWCRHLLSFIFCIYTFSKFYKEHFRGKPITKDALWVFVNFVQHVSILFVEISWYSLQALFRFAPHNIAYSRAYLPGTLECTLNAPTCTSNCIHAPCSQIGLRHIWKEPPTLSEQC